MNWALIDWAGNVAFTPCFKNPRETLPEPDAQRLKKVASCGEMVQGLSCTWKDLITQQLRRPDISLVAFIT